MAPFGLFRRKYRDEEPAEQGDQPEAASGNWAPPRGLLEGDSCNAFAVLPNLEGGQPMQARLPTGAGAGVYRICQWDDCVEFEYRR